MGNKKPRISQETRDLIKKYRKETCATYAEIAEKFGVSISSIGKILRDDCMELYKYDLVHKGGAHSNMVCKPVKRVEGVQIKMIDATNDVVTSEILDIVLTAIVPEANRDYTFNFTSRTVIIDGIGNSRVEMTFDDLSNLRKEIEEVIEKINTTISGLKKI